jgi:hypothetical protein
LGFPRTTLALRIERVIRPPSADAEASESAITLGTPTLAAGDSAGLGPHDTIDTGVVGLEIELRRLRVRCRAREDALDRAANALLMLRRANRALAEENAILRGELDRLQLEAAAQTQAAPKA